MSRVHEADTQTRALNLRRQGWSYQEIANELGYADPSGAYRAIESGLKAIRQEPGEAVLKMELARLDSYLVALERKIQAGDAFAVQVALQVSQRRAKLLGLDRPDRTEAVQIVIPGDPEKLRAELMASLRQDEARLAEGSSAADPSRDPQDGPG